MIQSLRCRRPPTHRASGWKSEGGFTMAANDPKLESASRAHLVAVSNWQACHNSGDDCIVLSCTVTAVGPSASISGAGLILNDGAGETLGTCYAEFSGSQSVNLALNLPRGSLKVGDAVMAVANGEADQQHYFVEQNLTITNC